MIDGKILIDFTADKLESFAGPAEAVFITRSHSDHYDPDAIGKLVPQKVYANESWADDAAVTGLPVVPMRFGKRVDIGDMRVMQLSANHSTARPYERAGGYLFEKDG